MEVLTLCLVVIGLLDLVIKFISLIISLQKRNNRHNYKVVPMSRTF